MPGPAYNLRRRRPRAGKPPPNSPRFPPSTSLPTPAPDISRADSITDLGPPTSAVRFDLQVDPSCRPQPVQIVIFPSWTPSQEVLCLHLKSPDDLKWHFEPASTAKRALPDMFDEEESFQCRPTKRLRTAIQLDTTQPSHVSLTPSRGQPDQSSPVFNVERPGYLMNLGLLKLFPASQQQPWPSTPTRYRRDGLLIVVFIIAGVIFAIAIVFLSISQVRLVQVFPRHRPILVALDWNERAIQIEMGLAAIPRIILFGEMSQESPEWLGSPGLRPEHGSALNDTFLLEDVLTGQPWVDPAYFSNSTFFRPSKPWESTSTGIYVSNHIFLNDLFRVVTTLLMDLKEIADHGPPSFFFTSGDSSQFRWSTSGNSFLAPHDSLPTMPRESAVDWITASSTIAGLPPLTACTSGCPPYPSPTARPHSPAHIHHLDPGLTWLASDIRATITMLKSEASEDMLKRSHFWEMKLATAFTISRLGMLQNLQWTNNSTWGSDDARLSWLREARSFTVNLPTEPAQPASVSSILDASVPTDVPADFIKEWKEYMNSRTVDNDSGSANESSTKAQFDPSFTPSPNKYAQAQSQNVTALKVYKILDDIFSRPLDRIFDGKETAHTYGDINVYSQRLHNLTSLLTDLDQRISQVRDKLTPDSFEGNLYSKRLSRALRRLEQGHKFISEIAVARLREASQRASRGVALLEEIQQQQATLRTEIDTIRSRGWVSSSGRIYYYLPCLQDLAEEWSFASQWMYAEAVDVVTVHHSRGAEVEEYASSLGDDIIWSRWNLTDRRRDPGGQDALKWTHDDGNQEPEDVESGSGWRWWPGNKIK